MSGTFEETDTEFYIGFGISIACNFLSLFLTPILLTRHWKRNILAVSANFSFIIANWIQFSQQSIDCAVAAYLIQFFVISGTILQVVAPLSRSYKLFEKDTKRALIVLVFLFIISEFLSYQGMTFQCYEAQSQFAYIHINAYSEVLSIVFGGVIYVLSFYQIIKVINSGEYVKENSRMKVVVMMAKSSIFITVAISIGSLIRYFIDGYGSDGDNSIEMVIKSLLSYFMVLLSFFLEISGKSESEKTSKMSHHSSEKRTDISQVKVKSIAPRWTEELGEDEV